ncbi:RUN and FYVE domain-containing protein 2 isoform X1 [Drosophila subpulchrella]|uniref:RUN and FYVE domain-containing protein 2 isoform X1 n=1 Tax=Drosophila subpulchrella TaxID=1486046 RepID=UPI0018A160A5|nr:RUN and FYVE domain-containing protein 2 isoform X1 [Drosophila subpulchrella]XP_037714781.1 RUN and FYVE domain-containing protein 2 isoform X1 [Drosophila subpulchrella]
MRGLVEDTKKTKLSSNNNNISTSSSSNSSRLKSASTVPGSSASGSSSKPLRSAVKTPTMSSTTSLAAGATAAKKASQTGQQQVGKSAKSSTAATTNATGTGAATTRAQAAAAKTQKGQNPPPQQVQPKQQQQPQQQQPQTQQPPLVLQPQQQHQANNSSNTIALPKASHANTSEELAGGVQDTIYLCNFRVSVDGEWLCLKELQDIDVAGGTGSQAVQTSEKQGGQSHSGFGSNYNGGSNSSKRNSKRYSGLSSGSGGGNGGSGGGGALDITDNGIMAIENLIGRRLCDMVHSGSSALGQSQSHSQSQSHQSVGLFAEWSHLSRDTAEIERSNLVNICKLVVKELLEQSLRYGRMLDSDHLPLQHFFIVIEHVLGHGLRPKKGLLGPRKELWDLLQSVEHYCPEAQDITASVRDLPTVRTHIGRARAWLRIALMQKKLSDYLQALIEHRDDSLYDYYEPHALMMSDEIVVIMGILVGLNVIDCNLCVKEEDLDSQQGVIDFSLYLRSSSRNADDAPEDNAPPALLDATGQGNMIAVLDQKNYIEELNRHLNATVGNLQAKVESLTTTNALMKEDLAIARNSLLALQAENQAMRQSTPAPDNNSTGSGGSSDKDKEKASEELVEERRKTSELEKELKLQVSLKAESDMAMKLLEKDIHEKQDTIVSLRRQLDDIKQINLEMYRKLQDCKASLTHKTELMTKLEVQKEDMASIIDQLEKKWTHDKSNLGEILKTTSQTLTTQVTASEERAARAEAESRIEREWRISLQEKELKLKEKISNLQGCLKELAEEKERNGKLKADLDKVRTQWSEAQTTLEELGIQLSVSKLKVSEMQDQERRQRQLLSGSAQSLQAMPEAVGSPGIWAPDSIATHCTACEREFNLTRRKHHCRSCGEIFCKACSEHTLPLINAQGQPGKPVRVCDNCYAAK